jgi:hypothetical protein
MRSDLSPNAKLLFGLIAGLARAGDGCFASNAYLAKRLGLSNRSVSPLIAELKAAGLISEVSDRAEGAIPRRTLQPTPDSVWATPDDVPPIRPIAQGATPDDVPEHIREQITEKNKDKGKDKNPLYLACRESAKRIFLDTKRQTPAWTRKEYSKLAELVRRKCDLGIEDFEWRFHNLMDSTEEFTRKQASLGWFADHFDNFLDGPVHRDGVGLGSRDVTRRQANGIPVRRPIPKPVERAA